MRLFKIYSLIVIFLFLFCSCVKGGSDLQIELSPSGKNINDLVSVIYDETQLTEIVEFNGSLNRLNKKFPIECLRDNNNGYRVSYLGKESVAIVTFDSLGNKIIANIYSLNITKSEFDGLSNGHLLDEVMTVDPNGEYLFLYAGRNDIPRMSTHYTKDGYLITVEYDETLSIVEIKKEFI